ncbi:MAG TPA: glycosyltransferase family 4 protein, partial [Actinomycetota bacterium]|nr:glycosyltransferase family 4 protein [Actinomycetota bacterium]
LVRYLRSDFNRLGFDLIHLHGYRATHLAPALRQLRPGAWELPVVGTCHLLAEGSLRRALRSALELRSYRYLDLLIASSAEQARRASCAAPAVPVRYVPNGVRLPEQRPAGEAAAELRRRFGFPAGSDVVASIGRLHVQKRPDLFLRACRVISAESPGARFLMVGDGPERRRLERQAGELQIEPFVCFAGFVEDVPQICRGLTLLMHSADNEGTPRAVLHAMAAGCPVVATASGGVADLVGDGVEGLIVPKGDVEGLARSALWMLANPVERLEMGGRALKRVESDFSIEVMRQQVEDGYRYAVGSSRGRGRR